MKKFFTIISLICLGYLSYGQQQVLFTQYMFNQLPLNAAYTGIHEGVSASMLWREQWVGFEGAPSTQTFSVHSPIAFRAISLGGVIMRDKIGVTNQLSARFMYAYRLQLGKTKLSFGLEGSLHHYRSSYNEGGINDPILTGADQNIMKPNVGTGILWHGNKFYMGVGIPNAMNQQFYDVEGSESELVRHYYITGGYVFAIYDNLLVKPNFMLKAVKGAPVQADLNINVLLQNTLWVGMSYRSFESIAGLVQFQLGPKMQVGYSFDFWTTTDLSAAHSGSHEIMLNYVFELPKTKILTPRYF
ncbi:MAG: hypothetical protein CMB80_25540 [Flammeovirgaceae bacterium]|nr:hypothetical protein [Flammeovirgaceae bacterium]MBE61752.1 hypothetical protein [Flammeovirgaceae bacterium]MBR07266.1 hypothetical protein [Rickettsiales bacterium]HCX24233.1 hypothetical protein [Cytophagales bacterium]|tara:strand:- start:3980 stop:4882 length:903 start_codon:yes stop_codon:yes gene_type:complete